MLSEAKARIDHPEDLVFEEGSSGAQRALDAMKHAAVDPTVNSVKWDGTPAIIFGRDENGFIMAMKHKIFDVQGVQFHPESILTPSGELILRNWLQLSI